MRKREEVGEWTGEEEVRYEDREKSENKGRKVYRIGSNN